MTANNTIAAKEQVAHHLTSTWLGDLPAALPECFQVSRCGLSVKDGFSPSKADFEHGVALTSSMLGVTKSLRSSFNLILGDMLRLLEVHYGQEESERIKGEYITDNGIDRDTLNQIQKVCEGFPAEEDRDHLTFTHLQLLLPKKHDYLKGEISKEDFQGWMETARDGEKTILNGEVVATRPLATAKLRAKMQEAAGKVPKVKATLSDPTHDADRLRLAEDTCKALLEIRDKLPARWSLVPPSVAQAVEAWEAHMDQKNQNLS